MNEKFFDLAREKQDRMINGAIEVFAKNGYKHASTDDMVKTAGISKGLWFHYFNSKEGIYVFAYDYCVKYMLLELSSVIDEAEKDFFEIIKKIAFARIKAARNYPYITAFLEKSVNETESDILGKISDIRQNYEERMENLVKYADIESVTDKSKREKIKKITEYTVDGILRGKSIDQSNTDTTYKEIKSYIDLIKDMTLNISSAKKGEPKFMV
jgi:AcrR family transcriptional regulator